VKDRVQIPSFGTVHENNVYFLKRCFWKCNNRRHQLRCSCDHGQFLWFFSWESLLNSPTTASMDSNIADSGFLSFRSICTNCSGTESKARRPDT